MCTKCRIFQWTVRSIVCHKGVRHGAPYYVCRRSLIAEMEERSKAQDLEGPLGHQDPEQAAKRLRTGTEMPNFAGAQR